MTCLSSFSPFHCQFRTLFQVRALKAHKLRFITGKCDEYSSLQICGYGWLPKILCSHLVKHKILSNFYNTHSKDFYCVWTNWVFEVSAAMKTGQTLSSPFRNSHVIKRALFSHTQKLPWIFEPKIGQTDTMRKSLPPWFRYPAFLSSFLPRKK